MYLLLFTPTANYTVVSCQFIQFGIGIIKKSLTHTLRTRTLAPRTHMHARTHARTHTHTHTHTKTHTHTHTGKSELVFTVFGRN